MSFADPALNQSPNCSTIHSNIDRRKKGVSQDLCILRFKNLPPFRHYAGLQNHV